MGAITQWKQLHEAEGIAGFEPRHKGRKGYLSEAQKASVLDWLKQKPIWTLNELENYLASEYEVVAELLRLVRGGRAELEEKQQSQPEARS